MQKNKCPHGQSWFCKTCSKSILVVYYLNNKNSTTGKIKPVYYYSSLISDKKEKGITKFLELIEKNKHTIQSYIIYNNNPRTLIKQQTF